MDIKDGGDFGAPPPVSGLGNYKGVMLCNRPTEDSGLSRGHGGDPGVPPFRAMVPSTYRDQVGLPPCKQEEAPVAVKSRGPSAALRRHVRWIKDLQEQVQADQQNYDSEMKRQGDRKESMQEVFKQQRDAIRKLRKESDSLDRHDLEAVMEQFPPTGAKARRSKGQKPVWAMTEQEKEACEEEEAADLIRFAEELDFDQFVGDLEFRKHVQAMQDRARKLQKEQDAFKDSIIKEFNQADDDAQSSEVGSRFEDGLDGASILGDLGVDPAGATGRRRRRRDGDGGGDRPDWDGSTACGDETRSLSDGGGSKAFVDHILESHPGFRSVHSKDSIQRLVEKARSEGMPATPSTY